MIPTKDTIQFQELIEAQSERTEKDMSYKWNPEKGRFTYIYIRKNRLQVKKGSRKSRRLLYYDKGVNS